MASMAAQVSFLDGELSLIHIPLDLYAAFLQSVLQVLLPQAHSLSVPAVAAGALTPDLKHYFFNFSITPVECSVVCHRYWARTLFEPAMQRLHTAATAAPDDGASISAEAYVALCIISGGGMDAGSRVVDLTSPLALAGIPIFFVTTYYCDYILVPSRHRLSVVQALLARGCVFSAEEDLFTSPMYRPATGAGVADAAYGVSTADATAGATAGITAGATGSAEPTTPPPSNAAELQTRTFRLLRRRSVVPRVVPDLYLVHCSGVDTSQVLSGGGGYALTHRSTSSRGGDGGNGSGGGSGLGRGGGGGGDGGNSGNRHDRRDDRRYDGHRNDGPSWADTIDSKLYTCLVAAMVLPPKFLSVTLTAQDPPSVLLDKALLPMFGQSLVGGDDGGETGGGSSNGSSFTGISSGGSGLVPIFLDLVDLPFEATGIVSGVAGRLVSEMRLADVPELSYLSTSKAGAVILDREHAKAALEILQPLLAVEEETLEQGA